ncbi:ABC transporter transmembrane domain-containing protein [Reinekea blandensis]|uniref:Multidrug resistance-like ATP-binding protein MdlA n=1 Tax=Reinekea blandensis MED297 TaxID=314283 RepID=A4BHU4_9GAMM|nr:ABC transporter transmembrane domain-containing protein [Reinekea blandensis]EAR08349.1 ABC-type multidrug transport system, ATPase and permease component [Reinekea sp. MED297] [Reinekea blandensis MED297]
MQVFWQLRWFFRQQWRRYTIALVALVIVAFATMLPPWMIGQIVDSIGQGTITRESLFVQIGWILAAAVISYAMRVTWRIALFGASYDLANVLRQRIFLHLSVQPPSFFQKMKTGDLMARATNDVQAIEMTAGEAVLALFDGALTGLMVLLVMTLFISFPLTLIALLPWPIVGFFMWKFGKELHASFHTAQAKFSELNDDVQESISALRLTRAFGRELVEQAQFDAIAMDANAANQRVARTDSKYDPVIQMGVGFSFLLSVAGGAWLIVRGDLTLGQLTSFTLYLGYMIWPMFAVGWLLNLVERGQAAYQRIDELLNMTPAIADQGTDESTHQPTLSMAINEFRYSPQGEPALQDIHLTVPKGHLLGIVGHTGAGKSTLIQLLTRADEGPDCRIELDGVAIDQLTLHNLRRHLACVPQTPFLFSTTIAENIAMARPDATQAEIEAAANVAQVHEDILRFPDGYRTEVGERGVTLSGGQKQRIAIARALLQDAPILILDDALSAVDVKTEQSILEHLRDARQGKTTLIICHRLSAVETADHIIVLNHGEIEEQGTHRELLAAGGSYRRTFDYQQLEQVVEAGQ